MRTRRKLLTLGSSSSLTENQPNLEDYDGIIIGSDIKVGQWTKETKKFVENNLEFFKNSNVILGVFVSSGLASNPEKIAELKFYIIITERKFFSFIMNIFFQVLIKMFSLYK